MSPIKGTVLVVSFFLVFLTCICHSSAFSQIKISGFVRDLDSQALQSVTITVKNSKAVTVSTVDGSFSINARPGDFLIFSFTGMQKKIVQVQDEQPIIVTMTYDRRSLEEVVMIGYGTLKKKDLTGAISKISFPEFNTGIITDPLQQIQGKVAGLSLIKPGGDPNGEFTVRLRGATSIEGQTPLLVIDAVAIDDFYKAISTLNPADIESYDVLKDASATAIYGSRGANGVILVTTKRAKTGKMQVEYNGFVGMEKVANSLPVLNAAEWRKATANLNAGGIDQGGNTDWQKAISQTAISQSHMISISSGTDRINMRASAGYIKQQGVIINTGKEIFTGRIMAVQKSLNNKLEIRYGLNASVTKRDFLPDQSSTSQSRATAGAQVFTIATLPYLPVWPIYNPDGSYFMPPSKIINPLMILQELYSKQRENFFQGSLKADYEILKGFTLGTLLALSRGNDVYDRYYPPYPNTNSLSEASKYNYNRQSFSGDIHGNYHKIAGKHAIDITGVYEYNRFVNDGFGLMARGVQINDLLNNNLGGATNILLDDIFSYKNEVKLISFLGRAVYNYADRYILTASFRRDGSSKFGPNNRWGNFPSIAAAWRISNEHFFKNISWVNNLKFRISYGSTGNQENLPPNAYDVLYGTSGPYLYNGQIYQSFSPTQENNPDLKWEVRKSFNVGLDFSILKDRLNGTIDIFNDRTDGMLFKYGIPQPPFLKDSVYANAANSVNKGVEISLNGNMIKNKNFSWEVIGNFATLRNHITGLLGQFKGFDLNLNDKSYGTVIGTATGDAYVTQLTVGYPVGVFWLPQHAGLDANGQELFNNFDADGKFAGTSNSFSDQDKQYIDPTPRFTWGLTNTLRFKNFDGSFFLRGVQGQKIFANSLLMLGSIANLPGANVIKGARGNGFANTPQASDYWLKDASYCRLENISLGYSFSGIKGITKFRLYITVNNVFVITNYEGVDPEAISESRQRYIDINYYPKTRGISLGANLEF